MARYGVSMSRRTLARWVIAAAKALQPVHNLLRGVRGGFVDARMLHIVEIPVR